MNLIMQQAINNYDLSDLINQAVIVGLILILAVQSSIKIRWRRPK